MTYGDRIRWTLAFTALMFAALTVASLAHHEDFWTVASSALAAVVLGAAWYGYGWLQNR